MNAKERSILRRAARNMEMRSKNARESAARCGSSGPYEEVGVHAGAAYAYSEAASYLHGLANEDIKPPKEEPGDASAERKWGV